MKRLVIGLVTVASLALSGCGGSANAITVDDPWVRVTNVNAAAYMTINNGTDSDQVLTSVSVDPAVAEKAELHQTTMGSMDGMDHSDMSSGDMMSMEPVSSIDIPSGQSAVLASGQYHLMLVGIKGNHPVGSTIALTLTFQDGAQQVVNAEVRE